MRKAILILILSTLLLMGTIVPATFADAELTDSRFQSTGKYSIVASGVGLEGTTSGAITLNVPGQSVVAAYLYWSGLGYGSGDNQVLFQGIAPAVIENYDDAWYSSLTTYVYVAEVTSQVTTGNNIYNIAEVGFAAENYGVGLIVVYEDSALPTAEVTILEGLDGFHFDWADSLGPNSEVTSLEFTSADYTRTIEMTLFAGGTETNNRPNALWTETGTSGEPIPENLITSPTAPTNPGDYPLFASDGNAWDSYTTTIPIPEEHEWLGVQIESIVSPGITPDYDGRGTSAVLVAAGFVLPIRDFTPPTCGKVTGGGQIPIGDGKKETATFGLNAMTSSKEPGVKGELQYLDHTTGMLVHAHIVETLEVWEELVGNKPWPLRKAKFTGPCTVNHKGAFTFEVYVEDNGEPGKADYFNITIFDADGEVFYEAGDTISRGNIQIHKCTGNHIQNSAMIQTNSLGTNQNHGSTKKRR